MLKKMPQIRRSKTGLNVSNSRIILGGLGLSAFTVSYVYELIFDYGENFSLLFCYMLLTLWPTFELYNGLRTGDRKQYVPWIVLKSIEVIASTITVIHHICTEPHIMSLLVIFIPILGIILTGVNSFIAYLTVSKYRQHLKEVQQLPK